MVVALTPAEEKRTFVTVAELKRVVTDLIQSLDIVVDGSQFEVREDHLDGYLEFIRMLSILNVERGASIRLLKKRNVELEEKVRQLKRTSAGIKLVSSKSAPTAQ